MYVLGISAFYHDSAAALVRDGEIIAAAQEERFTRRKNDAGFPAAAVRYCLEEAGIGLGDVEHVAFYDKPILTFDRLLETYFAYAPRGFQSFSKALPEWVKKKLFLKDVISRGLTEAELGDFDPEKLLFGYHHHSHAAAAFYPSPFDDAAVLVMDGVGEWATTSTWSAGATGLDLIHEIKFPHSLGLLYAAFTYYLGFKVNDGEYKVMGLAPYGTPKYVKLITDNLIDVKHDGSFHLNMSYFNYCTGLTMTNDRFAALFGHQTRKPTEPLRQVHMDIAASIQAVSEVVILKIARSLCRDQGSRNLCLAGGVALNCVANGKVLREGNFQNIWVQPASGDSGCAIGVALAVSHEYAGVPRHRNSGPDGMSGAYLGPSFDDDAVRRTLDDAGAVYHRLDDAALFDTVAASLAAGNVVGWFQGRMEFGPRALGNRSILGDARSQSMQKILNLKIKYRESFRPFAPAVLAEDVEEYFEFTGASPYMMMVAPVNRSRQKTPTPEQEVLFGIDKLNVPRSDIPAVTHVDYSARIQTVHRETNLRFYRLLEAFKRATGCGVLVNTSFNIRDEPIVCTPRDAWCCFMGTEMEMLVLNNFVLRKDAQG
jgi:carbamoyltransferase